MSKFVRASKYRHVFVNTPKQQEDMYSGVKPTTSAWDFDYITANNTYWACAWAAGNNSTVAVWDMKRKGKMPTNIGLIEAHKGPLNDLQFHPFDQQLLATVGEDCKARLFKIPEGGVPEDTTITSTSPECVQTLSGHLRKVGLLKFHPTANQVLATTGHDFKLKLWDLETGSEHANVQFTKYLTCLAWNRNGSSLAITGSDKDLKICDPRTGDCTQIVQAHQGTKGMRCIYVEDHIITLGFSKAGNEREYMIWDPRNFDTPVSKKVLDSSSGVVMPFYDEDTKMLYLAGKGDGNVRYMEWTGEGDMLYPLNEYKSNAPTRGMCFIPKTGCDVNKCEVALALKIHGTDITPLSFVVPRKSDLFQDDIFPDTASGTYQASMTAAEYFGGANKDPVKVSLANGFVAPAPTTTSFVSKPEAEEEDMPKDINGLKAEVEKLRKRVAFLEAELDVKNAQLAKK